MRGLDHVFVYGTLKTTERNHGVVAPWVVSVAPATLADWTLLSCSHYPGARPSPGDQVEGQLLGLREPRVALQELDRLEEHPHFLRRRRVLVRCPEGRRVRAWFYELVRLDAGWAPCGPRWPVST